jgi:YesN/AraC family two-component response regulator
MPYSVVVAEDEPLLLENLIEKIENSGTDFHVVGSAPTGIQAYDLVEECSPDLLITDIRMPVMDGLELISKVRNSFPGLNCIIVSGYSDFEYAKTALHYQVKEYLLKPVDPEELTAVLNRIRSEFVIEQQKLESIFSVSLSQKTPEQITEILKDYIIHNFNKDINLNLIAMNLNYSPSYLTRMFCQKYDQTPSKFLISLRIQKAKQLLDQRYELNIRQIGEAVGYPEQGYFSRIFKKATGLSPLEYRDRKET